MPIYPHEPSINIVCDGQCTKKHYEPACPLVYWSMWSHILIMVKDKLLKTKQAPDPVSLVGYFILLYAWYWGYLIKIV